MYKLRISVHDKSNNCIVNCLAREGNVEDMTNTIMATDRCMRDCDYNSIFLDDLDGDRNISINKDIIGIIYYKVQEPNK